MKMMMMTAIKTTLVYLPALNVSRSKSFLEPPRYAQPLISGRHHRVVSIGDFLFSVSPTVAIPESPSEVFELMFTPFSGMPLLSRQICMWKWWWEMKGMLLGIRSKQKSWRLTWDSESSWDQSACSIGWLLELRPHPSLLPHTDRISRIVSGNLSLSSFCRLQHPPA